MTDASNKRLQQLRQARETGVIDEDTYRAAVAALGNPSGVGLVNSHLLAIG